MTDRRPRGPRTRVTRAPREPDSGDELIEVRMTALAPGGDTVGRQQGGSSDGRVVFVPLAAPGETVDARVVRHKARVAWADLVAITQPSSYRVAPPCPLFGRCGGCQWQHVDLSQQRAAKREIVARALGLLDVPLIAPVADGQGYRDRAQMVVGGNGEIGFRARRSHDVVDVPRCLLLSPQLDVVLTAIRASAVALREGTEIDLQAGRDGVHVNLRLPRSYERASAKDARSAFAGMLVAWGAAGVVGLRVVGAGQPVTLGARDVDIHFGHEGDDPLRVPAAAFAQVGRAANLALVSAVLDAVGLAPGAVLELYAGSGNFTRGLSGRAIRVVASDADRAAVARGRRNAPTARWVDRPPADVDADTVVADPPREGLDAENLRAVIQARHRVVYVSCDPQTLGRDAALLARAGFTLRGALAFDLMPHTFHVEVVATFDRP